MTKLMITMNDIAAKAGVSQSTVSLVLNNRQRRNGTISDATRQRILQVADEMGYRRNELARAMVTGKNRVLGFITRHASAEIPSRLIVGAHEEANAHGYSIKLLHLSDGMTLDDALRRSVEQRLSGLLAVNLAQNELDTLHQQATHYRFQVAMLDDNYPQGWGVRVTSDDNGGIGAAVSHLVEYGHQRIAFMAPPPESFLAASRRQSFSKAMQSHKLHAPDEYIVAGSWWDHKVNEPLAQQLLQLKNPPTALVCSGDAMAMMAIRGARAIGCKLPDNLSVTGYGNSSCSHLCDPSLTTIVQPFEEIGRVATRHILGRADADDWANNPIDEILPTSLLVRASTAPPGGWG